MRLRNNADVRVLVWAFLFFPLVPAVAFARPDLRWWLLPPALYLGYIAGVLAHYQNHRPVFRGRRMNRFYGAWLSVFYGYPIFAWIPTHNQNHHKFVNGPGDATRTWRLTERDSLLYLVAYPLFSAVWQAEGIKAYVAKVKRSQPARYREVVLQRAVVLGAHVSLVALAVALHGAAVGLATYALVVGVPALFASWSMMFTNYVQHVDCDHASPDDHSRNFVGSFQNWLVFDAGFHTVHHENPATHWSEYRRLHRERAAAIDPRLNQNSIFGFCFKRYFLQPCLDVLSPRQPHRS